MFANYWLTDLPDFEKILLYLSTYSGLIVVF